MTKVVISGAAGRMGRFLITLISESKDLVLHAAVDAQGHPDMGRDAGEVAGVGRLGVPLTDRMDIAADGADVIVEFSSPQATMVHLKMAGERGVPFVIGTTGLDEAGKNLVAETAKSTPVVFAPNMSLGMNLLFKLVEMTAGLLGEEYDVEIVEMHHHHKKDAPSGTALRLAESAAKALGRTEEDYVCGREGIVGAREKREIGVMALRGGDVVGEHTVIFAGPGERLELTHRAHTRNTFAVGALKAARWLVAEKKRPGLYNMMDVLGLE